MRPKSSAGIPAWVLILALLTLTVGVGGRDLWTPDEPREAALVQGMGEGGSWLVPSLGGRPFVEKPPLYYWAGWVMNRSLGALVGTATAVRALSALAAALTLLATWLGVRACWGKERGKAAVLILATTISFFRAGHWIIIDPLLMFLVAAAVVSLFLGLAGDRPGLILGAYLAAGSAFLVKGTVAWALLVFPWGASFFLYRRQAWRRRRLHLLGAGFLALGIPLAWMRLFYLEAGAELWKEWFLDNQVGRFTGTAAHLGHVKGPLYYLWLLPLLLLPWTPALFGGIRRRAREFENEMGGNWLLVALAWGLGGLIVLSVSGTKREVYLYPLLPAFAAVMAWEMGRLAPWSRVALRAIAAVLVGALAVSSFLLVGEKDGTVSVGLGVNFAAMAAAAVGIYSYRRLRGNIAAQTGAAAALFLLAAVLTAAPVLNRVWSYRPMVEKLAAAVPPEARGRVCVWGEDEASQGVFFVYGGIVLPGVGEPERIARILSGEDPEFELIVVPRMEEFEEENPDPPPWKTLARARKGPRRMFHLISGN
ncbi:MAG TPA: glycosyltransferase family 39 protein [bacterium]|nr:glycosyltransferase family 39 protein [bacterium]